MTAKSNAQKQKEYRERKKQEKLRLQALISESFGNDALNEILSIKKVGRPRIHVNNAEKQKAYRNNLKAQNKKIISFVVTEEEEKALKELRNRNKEKTTNE